jgi:hypothetical protein
MSEKNYLIKKYHIKKLYHKIIKNIIII